MGNLWWYKYQVPPGKHKFVHNIKSCAPSGFARIINVKPTGVLVLSLARGILVSPGVPTIFELQSFLYWAVPVPGTYKFRSCAIASCRVLFGGFRLNALFDCGDLVLTSLCITSRARAPSGFAGNINAKPILDLDQELRTS